MFELNSSWQPWEEELNRIHLLRVVRNGLQGKTVQDRRGTAAVTLPFSIESFEFCHFDERQWREILEIMHR